MKQYNLDGHFKNFKEIPPVTNVIRVTKEHRLLRRRRAYGQERAFTIAL